MTDDLLSGGTALCAEPSTEANAFEQVDGHDAPWSAEQETPSHTLQRLPVGGLDALEHKDTVVGPRAGSPVTAAANEDSRDVQLAQAELARLTARALRFMAPPRKFEAKVLQRSDAVRRAARFAA